MRSYNYAFLPNFCLHGRYYGLVRRSCYLCGWTCTLMSRARKVMHLLDSSRASCFLVLGSRFQHRLGPSLFSTLTPNPGRCFRVGGRTTVPRFRLLCSGTEFYSFRTLPELFFIKAHHPQSKGSTRSPSIKSRIHLFGDKSKYHCAVGGHYL